MKYLGQYMKDYHHQIQFAFDNYSFPKLDLKNFDNIVISGLGGSGIAGQIIKGYFANVCPLPIVTVSDYSIPKFVGNRTLFIGASYSGNTEETITTCHAAKQAGATILAMTTGGKLKDFCEANQVSFCTIETGFQPRMALGYSLTYLFILFSKLCGIDKELEEFKSQINRFADTTPYKDKAAKLFASLNNEIETKIVVFTDCFWNAVGIRFNQQIQENAKLETNCFFLPEAMHNVLESMYGKLPSHFLFLHTEGRDRTDLSFKYLKKTLSEAGNKILEFTQPDTKIITLFEAIHVLDWVSLMLSEARSEKLSTIPKSNEIPNILGLKKFLSENPS